MPQTRSPVRPQSRRHAALATLVGTGGTVAITIGQAFVLIPLCLAYLGAHLYGAWLGASELLVWVQLLDMGIPNLLTQRIGAAVGQGDRMLAARWASTGMTVLAGIGAALAAVAIVAAPLVASWAQVPAADADSFTACFRIGAVASAFLLMANGSIGISRGVQLTVVVSTAQVAGALTGLALTVGLLVSGYGLWALALGLLGRSLVSLAGATLFVQRARVRTGIPLVGPSSGVLRETAALIPATAAGSAGYLFANNTEILLVTTVFGPVIAAIYTLTRRAIDGVRSLLDSVAWAVYGGFAHLVTADDRHRARAVLREILWVRFAVACLCGAVAVAVNRPFVTLLFGPEHFGGFWLTLAFAVQMIAGGQGFLANYLLRAAGRVREGSFLLAAEAVARVTAMVGGLLAVGLAGAPAAAAATSVVALVVMLRWLDRDLPRENILRPPVRLRSRLAPVLVFGLGVALASAGTPVSWTSVTIVAGSVAITGGAFLWLMLPMGAEGESLLRWKRT
jgi:O-antigen/teichoic acid export membrane protein